MLKHNKKPFGQSTFEFVALTMFILGAFLVFQKYISQGLAGRWRQVGETFGHGRIFSPSKTFECAFDFQFHNVWYSIDCYEVSCDCQSVKANATTCEDCIEMCATTGDPSGFCAD